MHKAKADIRATLPEEVMLARLEQSEQMREFFIEMWKQNPVLAKQGGAKVQNLMTQLDRGDAKESLRLLSDVASLKQRGISLIELIMFIVIVSVALAGILLVMNVTTKGSADPLIHKQALAIAESLLEEVELMPFTICDPDDVNAASAVTAADCTGGAGGANDESKLPLGLENDVSRYHPTFPFDNVSDYNGFNMPAGSIMDITNSNTGLNGYTLEPVEITSTTLSNVAANDALLIKVTVTGPDGLPVVVEGIRTRYAPRTLP